MGELKEGIGELDPDIPFIPLFRLLFSLGQTTFSADLARNAILNGGLVLGEWIAYRELNMQGTWALYLIKTWMFYDKI